MRRLFWSLLVTLPATGLALTAAPRPGARTLPSSAAVRPAPSAAADAARAALTAMRSAPVNQRVPGHSAVHPNASPTPSQSFDWSGYADDNTAGNTYSKAAGDWVQPAITCTSEDTEAAFWVGIDGFSSNSNTVEQAGTLAQCFQGKAHYYTWWAMDPATAITLVGSTVAAGDKIAASVLKSGNVYTLAVTDSTTTANSFTKKQNCAAATCVDSSAEWIAEAPDGARGDYPLASFKPWSLTTASTRSAGKIGKISAFPDDQITMIDGTETYNLATAGALNAAGNAFKVTWHNSY